MSDLRDEEDIYQEELDMFLDDSEYEQHEDYEDFELEELSFWNSEKQIYEKIDYDFDNLDEEITTEEDSYDR